MGQAEHAPGIMQVYGSKISYYTGKFETYLRYRSIPYASLPTVAHSRKLIEGVGIVQMPVVRVADGRWMTDTTPMIAWLENQQDEPTIYPADPALSFIALLIEDYGDEWLWRAAMHYRWSYRAEQEQFLRAEFGRSVHAGNNREERLAAGEQKDVAARMFHQQILIRAAAPAAALLLAVGATLFTCR